MSTIIEMYKTHFHCDFEGKHTPNSQSYEYEQDVNSLLS